MRLEKIGALSFLMLGLAGCGGGEDSLNSGPLNAPASMFSISAQPESRTVTENQAVTFIVKTSTTEPLQYQWNKNGLPIAGATAAAYSLPAVSYNDNGAQFSVVVSDAAGKRVTSQIATLTVNPYLVGQKAEIVRLAFASINLANMARASFLPITNDKFLTLDTVCSKGSVTGTLNGTPMPAAGTSVPLGETLLATNYNSCEALDLTASSFAQYSGTSSVRYFNTGSTSNIKANTTFSGLNYQTAVGDVTRSTQNLLAQGMVNFTDTTTIASDASLKDMKIVSKEISVTPASDLVLQSLRSNLAVTFLSGSSSLYLSTYSSARDATSLPLGALSRLPYPLVTRWRFNAQSLVIKSKTYVIDGTLEVRLSQEGAITSSTGAITVTENGAWLGSISLSPNYYPGLSIAVDDQIIPYEDIK
jgi:hypothetical protein